MVAFWKSDCTVLLQNITVRQLFSQLVYGVHKRNVIRVTHAFEQKIYISFININSFVDLRSLKAQ